MEKKNPASAAEWEQECGRLTAEVARLERSLGDAKETLREQLTEDVKEQFDRKLKEAKKAKRQAEEDLEAAQEQSRSERRRLKGEIDRLEQEAAQAKQTARKSAPGEAPSGLKIQVEDAIRAKEKLDATLQKSTADWKSERERLNAEIQQLQASLVEALEQSSNPLRVTQAVKDQYESRLDEAAKAKTQSERDLKRATTEWEEERARLNAEIERLKRGAPPTIDSIRKQIGEKARAKAETQRDDTARLKEQFERQLQESRAKWETERHSLTDEIDQLKKAVTEAKATTSQRTPLEKEQKTAASKWEAERQTLTAEIDQRKKAATEAKTAVNQRAQLEMEFRTATANWETERSRWMAQIGELEKSRSETEEALGRKVTWEVRAEYEAKLQEAGRLKAQVEADFQASNAKWEAERSRLMAQIGQEPASAGTQTSVDVQKETDRVEAMIREISAIIDDPATGLSTVILKNVERAEVEAYLKGLRYATGQGESRK